MSRDAGEFQLVSRGVRPKRRVSARRERWDSPPRPMDIVTSVVRTKEDSKMVEYASLIGELLQEVRCEEIVCYGIGLFGTCYIARHQLALLVHIASSKQARRVLVYDPVLRSEEKAALEELGCVCITENELCRREVQVGTVFYMPHCGRAMYNNLMWANWSPPKLSLLTLIGNSFQSYWDRTLKQIQDSYILKAINFCAEKPLPPYIEPTIFNDLSVHTFPMDRLLSAPPPLWTPCPPPPSDTSDPEIIT